MKKYPIIGGSICAILILILGSFNNIVGYQTVQASSQKIITAEFSEKELLFQTIVDMANNKDIQRIILGSELTGKKFFDFDMRFSTFRFPVITEKFLKGIYTMGVILFRTLDKSKIQAFIEHHPVLSQGMEKELSSVIEKDAMLKSEITQLSSLSCGCEDENVFTWHFPVICTFLLILFTIFDFLAYIAYKMPGGFEWIFYFLEDLIINGAGYLHCKWY